MKSSLPKVLIKLKGRPLLAYVLETSRAVSPQKIVVVVGHKREKALEMFNADDLTFVTQEPQLGTGHAVAKTEETLADFNGDVVILSGDVPLITKETIERLVETHRKKNSSITVLTCDLDEPGSYGRIVRENDKITANVEAKDATKEELEIREINCGVYVFNKNYLFPALKRLNNENAQGEFYLTDLINMAVEEGRDVTGVKTRNHREALGVNTLEDLESLENY